MSDQSVDGNLKKQLRIGERWYIDKRLAGLSRFALAITLLNILGYLWLGFEQMWATPFVALAAAYTTEIVAETAQAWAEKRPVKYSGSPGKLISFLLSAHITALAVSMLLFAAEQLWVVAFAASFAVGSKWLFRINMVMPNGQLARRHFLNPSNLGITSALLLFPTVGISPPYMFSENTSGWLDWALPCVIIVTGSLLNTKLTGRMPLICVWLLAFAAQAIIRSLINGSPLVAGLIPMTGFSFILFTFYMVTDPATTPAKIQHQAVFAVTVALTYALLMQAHVVFGLFYSLTIVTAARGLLHMVINRK